MLSEQEKARALLDQALAEARSHGAGRIAALYFVTYGSSQETEGSLRRGLGIVQIVVPWSSEQLKQHCVVTTCEWKGVLVR